MPFLILFVAVPVIEMYLLITIGGIIGALPTIALVVLTATIGLWLLRREGLATLQRVQAELNAGQLPQEAILEGAMLLVGGALLLTPGFVTDAIGFTILIPWSRRPLARLLARQLAMRVVNVHTRRGDSTIIEGEFTEPDPANKASKGINHDEH